MAETVQKGDWIPSGEQDFLDLCQKWLSIMEDGTAAVAFGWNKDDCDDIISKINAFMSARAAYEADNSTINRIVKDETKANVKKAMRSFANSSVRYNKKMSKAAKSEMGVRTRKTNPSRNEAPSEQPDIIVENTSNRFEHKLRALNRATGRASKPSGVSRMKIGYQIGGEKPATGADLPKSKESGKMVYTMTHTEANKGKTVYYSICYENERGEQGPWSPIVEAIIG